VALGRSHPGSSARVVSLGACPVLSKRERGATDPRALTNGVPHTSTAWSPATGMSDRQSTGAQSEQLVRQPGLCFGGHSTLYKYFRSQSPDKNQKTKKDTRLSGMFRKTLVSFCMPDKSDHGTSLE
jgi:hypothetical protein